MMDAAMHRALLLVLLLLLLVPVARATPIQVYGVWHAGDDYCTWSTVRDTAQFDQNNHWIIDRGDGVPSVNLVILSFVHPLKLLDGTTDIETLDGVPRGMTQEIVDYFKSRGIRVMVSIGGITYVSAWEDALAQDASQLGLNAAALAQRLGVGVEIDYEGSSDAAISSLQSFIDAYRSVHPYDATGTNHAARLTIDLAAGDRWLIALATKATGDWLDPANPVLDYANAMVPSRQPSASAAQSNWQEHVDGNSRMSPPVPPLAPCKFTGSLYLTGHTVTEECTDFLHSVHYATRDYVQNVAPNGAGTTPGMLGYMFWAAECEGTHSECTIPPNTCEGGLGAGSSFFAIPIPMPPLRQDNPALAVHPPGPAGFALHGNAPNPFRSMTRFEFVLPEPSRVDLRVYDVTGQEVAEVVARDFPSGTHSLPWRAVARTGRPMAPGVYLCRLRAKSTNHRAFEKTMRIVIVR
jgi:hypothetical protein